MATSVPVPELHRRRAGSRPLGPHFENRNPADVTTWSAASRTPTSATSKDAVDAAAEAYKSWRLVPGPQRGEILYRVGEICERRKSTRAHDPRDGQGPQGNPRRCPGSHRLAFLIAGEGRRLFGETTPSELPNKFAMSVRAPIGVCALITPWNFPMAIPSWKSTAALVCGNTVVIKPATDTPLSAINFARRWRTPAFRRASSTSSPARARRSGCPLIKDPRVQRRFVHRLDGGRAATINEACAPSTSSTSSSRWAARTRSSSWTTRTSSWPSTARSGARSAPAASAARPPRASSCTEGRQEVHGDVRRARQGAQGRQRARREASRWARRSTRASSTRSSSTSRSARTRARSSSPAASASPARRTTRAGSSSPRSSATATGRCASPARRSSGAVTVVMPISSLEEAIDVSNDSRVRPLVGDLHAGREQGVRRDARPRGRHLLREPPDDRRRGAPAVRRRRSRPATATARRGSPRLDVFSEWKSIYVDYSGKIQKAQIDVRPARRPRRRRDKRRVS